MSDSHRLNLTLSSKLQTVLQREADRMGLATTELVRSIVVNELARRGAFAIEKSATIKSTTVVKNNNTTHTNTDITQAERLKRFWDSRDEETKSALRRGWPIPTYDDNPRIWEQTGEYEGAWVIPAKQEEFEAKLDAEYEEYQRQQEETTS